MINKRIELSSQTDANMVTYILDDGEFQRKGRKRPAVIICPGGGYTMISKEEGEPVALFFNRHGYHAFVVNYSVNIEHPFPTALEELARAVDIVKNKKEEWLIADEVSVLGFSAGGNLALSLGIFAKEKFLTENLGLTYENIRPDRLILGYPAVTLHPKDENGEVPKELLELMELGIMPDIRGFGVRGVLLGKKDATDEEKESLNLMKKLHAGLPPVFVWGSYEDPIITATDYTELASSLYKLSVPCELHLFGHGPHGMSLCDESIKSKREIRNLSMGHWTELCLEWLEQGRR